MTDSKPKAKERPGVKSEIYKPSYQAERKTVTVMFADISGFTSLSEKLDPENVRDMMNGCFESLVPIVEKYGGYVDKFIGDEIMALFGAPYAHEDDPIRALSAALDMVEELKGFNRKHKLDLGLHFGINTGLVIAGGIGTEKKMSYSVMGDTVNLASRLEAASEKGEILIGNDTWRRTRNRFDFTEPRTIKVKGKREPVRVYQLLSRRGKRFEKSFSKFDGLRFLVGRDSEMEHLETAFERLERGDGSILLIRGEAGIGKSIILNEGLKKHRKYLQLRAGNRMPGKTGAYSSFISLISGLAGINDDDDGRTLVEKLEKLLTKYTEDKSEELLPYISRFFDTRIDIDFGDKLRYLDANALKRQLYRSVYLLFEGAFRKEGFVIVFEDFHRIDASSLSLLEHILPLVKSKGVLFCLLSRPLPGKESELFLDETEENYGDFIVRINPRPLTEAESLNLAGKLAGFHPGDSPLLEKIISKAEGNPFFIEEIVRTLNLMKEGGADNTLLIPDTIQGLIMSRVDRLREDEKQVLKTSSVIGRSFHYRVLDMTVREREFLSGLLEELEEEGFVREKNRSPELEYTFNHTLAQEAVYESILRSRRQEIHKKVAEGIESVFKDRIEDFYEVLAFHYARGEEWEKAREYLLKAGDRAGSLAADQEAVESYRQALRAFGDSFGRLWTPLQRAVLERKMGEAYFRMGVSKKALEFFGRALSYLEDPLPGSGAALKLAIGGEIVKQAWHRLLGFIRGNPEFSEVSERTGERLRIYEKIGWIEAFGDNEKFFLIALKTINLAESKGSSYGSSAGAMGIGTMCDLTGNLKLADFYHKRAVEVAEAIENPAALRLAYNGMSIHYMCLGNWKTAVEFAEKAARIYRETGDIHGLGYVSYMLAVAESYMGNYEKALEVCKEIIKLGFEGGDYQVECWGRATKGFVMRRAGNLEKAEDELKQAANLALKAGDYTFTLWITHEKARVLYSEGKIEESLKLHEENLKYYSQHWSMSTVWLPYLNGALESAIKAAETAEGTKKKELLEKADNYLKAIEKHSKNSHGIKPESMLLKGKLEIAVGNKEKGRAFLKKARELSEKRNQPLERDTAQKLLEN